MLRLFSKDVAEIFFYGEWQIPVSSSPSIFWVPYLRPSSFVLCSAIDFFLVFTQGIGVDHALTWGVGRFVLFYPRFTCLYRGGGLSESLL